MKTYQMCEEGYLKTPYQAEHSVLQKTGRNLNKKLIQNFNMI